MLLIFHFPSTGACNFPYVQLIYISHFCDILVSKLSSCAELGSIPTTLHLFLFDHILCNLAVQSNQILTLKMEWAGTSRRSLIVHYMVSTCYIVTSFYVQHSYGLYMAMGNFHIWALFFSSSHFTWDINETAGWGQPPYCHSNILLYSDIFIPELLALTQL